MAAAIDPRGFEAPPMFGPRRAVSSLGSVKSGIPIRFALTTTTPELGGWRLGSGPVNSPLPFFNAVAPFSISI